MNSLVIVESPSKAKTIKKYLGEGYEVKASKGHVVDLPKSQIGVDPANGYKVDYQVTKKDSVKQLKDAFKDKDELILAVDPDREGEAIGWHIAQKLGVISASGKPKEGKKVKRIVFTSITKDSVQEAIKNPRSIDMNLVNAQQARRVLDRLVGYELSPLLWKKISFGLSAGRVQSVAVKLVVEREEEIEKFVADEYWEVRSHLTKKKVTTQKILCMDKDEIPKFDDSIVFELVLSDGKKIEIKNKEQAIKILGDIENAKWVIGDISYKQSQRNPKPPFTTSTLQQVAVNRLGYSAKRTMSIAQKLYESGHITYMRTDSTNITPVAIEQARGVILKKYGKDYLPAKPNFYKTTDKVAQEAHEAIRPSDFGKNPESLDLSPEEQKLYKLIYERTLSSQMTPALIENGTIEILVGKYAFKARGQIIKFKGYLASYFESVADNPLPADLKVGDELNALAIIGEQHYTQPRARFTEASLIKALESYGIGRPSTYVPIISTIQVRKYVIKEGKAFFPSDTGRVVTNLLRDHFPEIVDYEFTAHVESELDDVASGDLDWKKMMDEFYIPFHTKLESKNTDIDRAAYTVLGDAPKDIKCPVCSKKMIIKLGRFGRFYSCEAWPDCKGMLGMDGKSEEEKEKEAYSQDFLAKFKSGPKTDDGRDFLLKTGRFGQFWAHPDYPKVKDARPLEYTDELFSKVYGNPPIANDGTKMLLRRGKFGEFWTHEKYPEVKEVIRIDNKALKEIKKELGL